MRIRLLGSFEVSIGSRIIREDEWRLRKAASLVKLLALAPGHRLHRELVMDLLWPELSPKAAANNLHQVLHVARRTLEPEVATHRHRSTLGESLALCPDGTALVDVQDFEEAAEEARHARDPSAYRAALDLYAGDLLPDDRYEDWTEGRREELREALRRELGTEPSEASRRLHQEILAGRVAIGEPSPAGGVPTEPSDAGRHNLYDSLTSFIGREHEKEEVKRLLGTTRLLTLPGTGGCGKTRLAQEVARDLAGAHPDGGRAGCAIGCWSPSASTREKREGSGESDALRHRHAGWWLAFVERADGGLQGQDQASWVERLERERANAQAALGWALEAEPETALQLAAPLGQFWYRYGPILEGRRWLEAALARTGHLQNAARARARDPVREPSGLDRRGRSPPRAHRRAVALYRRLGDRKGVATSLTSLGARAYAVGDLELAVSLTEESLALKGELGDEKGLMSSRNNLGEMLQTAGDLARAQALFEENLDSDRIRGDEWGAAVSLLNLGTLAVEQEEPLRAQTVLLDALRVLVRLGDEDAAAECLTSLAGAAGSRGEGDRARSLPYQS